MATSLAKAAEMGFAEFASTLISETLNAIVTSILTQEKQAAQLEQQAQLTPEEYAKENLTDDLIRAEITRLFPHPTGAAGKSGIDKGEPYTNSKETGENPAIFNKTGYKITKGDLTVNQENMAISDNGYSNIAAAIRLNLARQHLAILQSVIARGIPRVYVDNGYISSKLALRFETNTTTQATQPSTPISKAGSRIAGTNLPRLIAQPVNANKPEYLTLKADVLSEVKITFKTVIP